MLKVGKVAACQSKKRSRKMLIKGESPQPGPKLYNRIHTQLDIISVKASTENRLSLFMFIYREDNCHLKAILSKSPKHVVVEQLGDYFAVPCKYLFRMKVSLIVICN